MRINKFYEKNQYWFGITQGLLGVPVMWWMVLRYLGMNTFVSERLALGCLILAILPFLIVVFSKKSCILDILLFPVRFSKFVLRRWYFLE